jgi:histidine kinase/DNA gyrase B/HSP90-like ATPase
MVNETQPGYFDLTPTPQLLQILGDLKFKGWQCIAELVDNSVDAILSSSNLSQEQKRIIVSIPTPAKIRTGEPVFVEDFADGMDASRLQNALRAGYSGKSSGKTIGLFGMGFNVATACLANKVEVWSSTKEMDYEIGAVIDLREMAKNKSFMREQLKRPKRHDKISGTEIKIYDFKKEAESILKVRDIVDNLNRAYTRRIFEEQGISIKVNQHDITPFKFCVWSERVIVKIKYEDIPAFVEIDEVLKQELFCENCLNWLGSSVETSLNIECPHCHISNGVVQKDVHVVGWVGIQRYPDSEHYGIDISRNGRILKKMDKSFFFWHDDRAKDDPRFQPEYPRDNPLYNGRIVGQIEANFIVPKYTKDDFNSDDANWKAIVRFLRGEMPLQTELGEGFGYKGLNKSPIGNLFRAYRRIDPPGRKTLMFAKIDGSGKSDPGRQKLWKDKFYDNDPKFVDEKTWLEEIDKAELKEVSSTFNIQNPTKPKIYGPGEIKIKSPNEDKYPGDKKLKKTLYIDISATIGEKPFGLTLFEYYPEIDLNHPIIFIPQGPVGKFDVYLNNHHPMFRDFADGYEDLLFMEIAAKYALMKNSEEWSVTRIYYELKSKFAPETMLSVPNLVTKASKLIRDIHRKLVAGDGIMLPRRPNLLPDEETTLKKKYLDLEGKSISDLKLFLMTTGYLKYLDLNYVFRFIEEYPDVIYDGKIINLPYAELDELSKQHQLEKYLGFFKDVRWFMNDLSKEGEDAVKKLKQHIIRNRYSIEILDERVNK